nr:CHAT domain-containing protein [Methanosarcina siciliae]
MSACETGLSEQRPGDELIGLTRAFLYAGSGSIIVSLWSVRADSTFEFMERFYRKIKEENMNKAEALQQVQVEFVHDEQYSNPYLWAPFVLIGDWK